MDLDSVGTSSRRSSEDAWPSDHDGHQLPDRLIQAAEALEEQAITLRRLASRPRSIDPQTQAPQQQMLQFGQPDDRSQIDPGPLAAVTSQIPYQLDPAAILKPDGTLATGLTPSGLTADTGEYATWWNINTHQQMPLQPVAGYSMSAQGSPSGGSSVDSVGHARMQRARMQRAFYGQLAQYDDTGVVDDIGLRRGYSAYQ